MTAADDSGTDDEASRYPETFGRVEMHMLREMANALKKSAVKRGLDPKVAGRHFFQQLGELLENDEPDMEQAMQLKKNALRHARDVKVSTAHGSGEGVAAAATTGDAEMAAKAIDAEQVASDVQRQKLDDHGTLLAAAPVASSSPHHEAATNPASGGFADVDIMDPDVQRHQFLAIVYGSENAIPPYTKTALLGRQAIWGLGDLTEMTDNEVSELARELCRVVGDEEIPANVFALESRIDMAVVQLSAGAPA